MCRFSVLLAINLLASRVSDSLGKLEEGSTYVVGGVDAAPGSYPHQVSIRYYEQYLCAGSILDKRNILTSGSCAVEIEDLRKYFRVHAGTNLLSAPGTSYKIHRVKIHEGYTAEPYDRQYDIAIVTLGEDIEFTPVIQPVELDNSTEDYENERATLIGWGSKGSGAISNDRLQEAEVTIVPDGNCQLVFQYLKDYQFCAYSPGTGICEADSGNGLILDNKQIGIASFNKGCATGIPDVYTRISYFIDWIEKNRSNSSDSPLVSTTLVLLSSLSSLFLYIIINPIPL